EQAILVNGSRVSGTQMRGVAPAEERKVGTIAEHISGGALEDLKSGEYRIVLGSALAEELGVGVGDTVIAVVSRGIATPFGVMPRMRRFTVSGILSAGMFEYDRGLA